MRLYSNMHAIQKRDSNDDLSGSLEGAGGIGGLLARTDGYNSSTGAWTNSNFYFADANGNITALVDTNQSLSASYRYDPFGNTISKSGTVSDANVYRFSSKEIHLASGMYYYGYRFYDPSLQRWVNRDPLDSGIKPVTSLSQFRTAMLRRLATPAAEYPFHLSLGIHGTANLYAFAANAPAYAFDPDGLMTEQQITINLAEANEENDYAAIEYWQAELDMYAQNAGELAAGDAAALQAEAGAIEATGAAEGALPLFSKCLAGGWAAAIGGAIGTTVANAPVLGGGTVSDWWGDYLGNLCPSCWNWVFW